MKQVAKIISLISMAVLIVSMMAATIIEKLHGTPAAFKWVYGNPVFIVFWGTAVVFGLIYLVCSGVHRRVFTMAIHLSFTVILVGALVTHLFGQSGEIHLREGEAASAFVLDDNSPATLPFEIRLNEFAVDYYSGSRMPSDYRSSVTFLPEDETVQISMNNIAKYRDYRFYQADYDEDLKGSILAVSHDPWGVGITYAGYILLLLSMTGFFFEKDTAIRAALRRSVR
ncbi:MAG: cytochrome c biogenesis protein ResB [Bacteroidales bacterium]|nr:cytochrome c biogenesis protein ResB [Bacteroidales bacterium]